MANLRPMFALACAAVALIVAAAVGSGLLGRSPATPQPGENRLMPAPGAAVCVRPGQRLRYSVELQEVPVGTVTVTGQAPRDGGRSPAVSYRLQTLPVLHWAWEFEATGTTVLDPETLLPRRVETTTRDRDGTTVTTSRFYPEDGTVSVTEQEPDEDEPDENVVRAHRAADAVAALLLLGAAEAGGRLTVVKGHDVYLARARPAGSEKIKLPPGEFTARKWTVTVREWDEDDGPAPSEHVLRVWVDAAGGLPLQVEADLLLGRLTARLISLSGSPEGRNGRQP